MYKIGIFGSAEGEFSHILKKAHTLGQLLAKENVILITGATTGIPHEVEMAASKIGATIWGFSPAINVEKHMKITPDCDPSIYKKLIFISKNFKFVNNELACRKYRNVFSTATCDAAVIISGKWGTLNEFTNLIDMGKVIGVLTGTGGIADELPRLIKKISKKSQAKIIFNNSPKLLVSKIIEELNRLTTSGDRRK